MGRRLRMSAELRDWLAELGESEPSTAAEVGAALVAVLQAAEPSDLAVVGQPVRRPELMQDDPRAAADDAYQRQLENLQSLRRRVADAATGRHDVEVRISAQRAAGADAAVLGGLAEQLAAAQLAEATLARACEVAQRDVDAFRTARATAKARYAAAEASLRIAEVIEAAGGEADPDLAQRLADLRAAEERLRAFAPPPHPAQRRAETAPGLLELRADPFGSDIRILLATEPADTVTLLAVLEGADAVSEHGARAIALASDLLTEIRDEGWPADIDEVMLAGAREFAEQSFPADDGSLGRRADELAAIASLGRLRAERHLTVEEVARRSGVPRHRVEAIERDGLRAARVHEAVALARALGARLELPGDSGPVAG